MSKVLHFFAQVLNFVSLIFVFISFDINGEADTHGMDRYIFIPHFPQNSVGFSGTFCTSILRSLINVCVRFISLFEPVLV